MKIGLVLSKPPSYSETFFLSKIKGLQKGGHEVLLFTQTKSKDFKFCKVKVSYPISKKNIFKQLVWFTVVFLKLLGIPKLVLKFIKLEKKQRTSFLSILKKLYNNAHILSEQLDWLHFGFATMALGKENVARTIGAHMAVSLRGFDMAIYPVKNPNCYQFLWTKVDKVHTISNDLLDLAYKNGLSKNVAYQKITPAIDINLFCVNTEINRVNNNSIEFTTVARLNWVKGLNYVLKAMFILKERNVNFRYRIIGEGMQYEELMYTIHLLGLTKHVFLVGKKSPMEVKALLASSEIYIQYSVSEGFCNAVLEAQAMGLLCVVSDAGGLIENVLHKKTGWVVPKRNPKKLANQLETLINLSEEVKNEITNNAKKRVQIEFNIEKQQQEFVKFYE